MSGSNPKVWVDRIDGGEFVVFKYAGRHRIELFRGTHSEALDYAQRYVMSPEPGTIISPDEAKARFGELMTAGPPKSYLEFVDSAGTWQPIFSLADLTGYRLASRPAAPPVEASWPASELQVLKQPTAEQLAAWHRQERNAIEADWSDYPQASTLPIHRPAWWRRSALLSRGSRVMLAAGFACLSVAALLRRARSRLGQRRGAC